MAQPDYIRRRRQAEAMYHANKTIYAPDLSAAASNPSGNSDYARTLFQDAIAGTGLTERIGANAVNVEELGNIDAATDNRAQIVINPSTGKETQVYTGKQYQLQEGQKPAPGWKRENPPSGVGAAVQTTSRFFISFLQILFIVIINFQIPLLFLGLFFGLYVLRMFHGDIIIVFTEAYEIVAWVLNYLIDWANEAWKLMRPFIPVYNQLLWLVYVILEAIFDNISISLVVDLLEILADAMLELVPVLVLLLETLIPVLVQLLSSIATIIVELIVNLLPVFIDLVQLLAQLIVALVPLLVDLIPIFANFIVQVLDSFGAIFVDLIEIIADMIQLAIPYVLQLVDILIDIANEIQANVTAGMDFFEFLGVFFAAVLMFVADIITVFVNMIVEIVTVNLPLITQIFIQVIQEIIKLIPPVIQVLIQIATQSFPVIVDLFGVIFQAVVDLIPVFVDVFNDLVSSGILTDLVAAIIDVFMVPHSPAILCSFAEIIESFVSSSLPLLEQVMITLFDTIITLIPVVSTLILEIASSSLLPDLLVTIFELLIDLIPVIINVILQIINSVVSSGIFQTLLEVIIRMFVDLIPPIINTIVQSIPLSLLVDLVIEIFNAIADTIPTLIDVLIDMVSSPVGINIIRGLVQALVSLLNFLFADNTILTLIPDLIIAIVDGLMSIFLGEGGGKVVTDTLQFIFNMALEIINPFFYAIADFATGSSGTDESNILTLVEPVIGFIETLFGALGDILELFGIADFLTEAFTIMSGIVDLLLPVADIIENVANAIASVF